MNANGAAARVAVIDADRRVQQSMAEVLRIAGLNVVGTAGDVRSALELMANLDPTVLVIDPRLPDVDAGASLLTSVTRSRPRMRVVVMGWQGAHETELAGADAFVSKSAEPEEFVAATIAACRC